MSALSHFKQSAAQKLWFPYGNLLILMGEFDAVPSQQIYQHESHGRRVRAVRSLSWRANDQRMGARCFAEGNQAQRKRANRSGRSLGLADDPAKRPLRCITRANADRRKHAAAHRAGGPEQVEQGARAACRGSNRGWALKQKWGREDESGDFPSDPARWTIAALCV